MPGAERKLELCPFPDDDKTLDRAREITDALGKMPDLSPGHMASLVTKMNHAVALGVIALKPQELTSLKTLSQKYIPDAPKQINLNAEVRTEQVILTWLNGNQDALQAFQDQAVIDVPGVEIIGLEEELTR